MPHIIRLPGLDPFDYDLLTDEQRPYVDELLADYVEHAKRNPLYRFEPFTRREDTGRERLLEASGPELESLAKMALAAPSTGTGAQVGFLAAGRVKEKMAIAGNRSGKTEIGVVDDLIQLLDEEFIPEWLMPFKFWEPPFKLRVVTMDLNSTLYGVMIPKFQALTPRDALWKRDWEKAFSSSLRVLRFANGSMVQFMSADQDREKHAGADLDRVHFDEEPPPPNGKGIYDENRRRTIDRSGQLMFTMTPLLGLSFTYDEIFMRRDSPDVQVHQWSMLDNPHLPPSEVVGELLRCKTQAERRAVIFGDFVHFRGRVLEKFNADRHLIQPIGRPEVALFDEVVIGYDPGVRRGGVVWLGFNKSNEMVVFDELYPSGMSVEAISHAMSEKNRAWGLRDERVTVVIDPAAWQRSTVSGSETVASELMRLGWNVIPGQNDRVAGILELQGRLENDALRVTANCVHWLHEQERWLVASDEEDAEMKPRTAKGAQFSTLGPDHLMDPTRYGAMYRAYADLNFAPISTSAPAWKPGFTPDVSGITRRRDQAPLGFMS